MHHTLRKSEILRGYSVFSDILKNGESVHGSVLRCYFKKLKKDNNLPSVRAGFAVPRRAIVLAVDRNKLKRFMREAYRKNKAQLCEAANTTDFQVALIFVFRNAGRGNVRRIRYASIESDLKNVMVQIISMMARQQ